MLVRIAGCMAMAGVYGPFDDAESVAAIRAAIDHGITLLDTENFYGTGHNGLRPIAPTLREVALATIWRTFDGRPLTP
jgi:aryl-alcohol dehydrogenase-like predicted oxidoreductase